MKSALWLSVLLSELVLLPCGAVHYPDNGDGTYTNPVMPNGAAPRLELATGWAAGSRREIHIISVAFGGPWWRLERRGNRTGLCSPHPLVGWFVE